MGDPVKIQANGAQAYADYLKYKDVPQDELRPKGDASGNARIESYSKSLSFRNPNHQDEKITYELQANISDHKIHSLSFSGGAGSKNTVQLNRAATRMVGTFDALLKSNGIEGGYNTLLEKKVGSVEHIQAAVDIIDAAKYYAGVDEISSNAHPLEAGLYAYHKFNDSISKDSKKLAELSEKGAFKINTDRIKDEIIKETCANFESEVDHVSYLAKKAKNRPEEMSERNWDDLRDKTAAIDSLLNNERFMTRAEELGVAPKKDAEHNATLYLAYNVSALEGAKKYGFKSQETQDAIEKAAHYGDLGKIKTESGYFVSRNSINNKVLSEYANWDTEQSQSSPKLNPKNNNPSQEKNLREYLVSGWDYLKESIS